MKYSRECPECGRLLNYTDAANHRRAVRNNGVCCKCANKKTNTKEKVKKCLLSKEAREKALPRLRGRIQTGRAAADERHYRASEGYLRAPNGVLVEFKNLAHFIRENRDLFDPDDVLWRNRPNNSGKRCRAYSGLQSIMPTKKNPEGSWKGWTVASMVESICFQGTDPLDRKAG